MSAAQLTRCVRLAGAALVLSLSAAHAFAEPPRHDALKMRNAPRASAVLNTFTQPEPAEPRPEPQMPEAPPAAPLDPAEVESTAKAATELLELCYELARRSDPSFRATVSLNVTVRADGQVELRAHDQSFGKGFFTRCVARKLAVIRTAAEPSEATAAATRTITLGEAPVAIVR